MEENVFDSISDIDDALDKEFGEVANEPEEMPDVEVTEQPSAEVEEPTEEDEKIEEKPKQEEEIEKPQEVEEPKENKKDYAFANLRAENGNLKKERDSYKAARSFK